MNWFFAKAISAALLGTLALVAVAAAPAQSGTKDETPPLPYEGTETIAGTIPQVDLSCVLKSWRITGVMVCVIGTVPYTCLITENAYPCGLIEVVRQPLRTHYREMGGFLKGLAPLQLFGKSSDHAPVGGDGTSLQFTEGRVYTFIPPLLGLEYSDLPLAKPQGPFFQVDYVTELDGWAWRSPLADMLVAPDSRLAALKSCDRFPDLANCAGTWGSYWPRIGFLNHPSQVLGGYLQALRAGRAASRPIGRSVLATYDFEPRTGHYIQMLTPSWRNCVSIGSPLTELIETGAGSKYGAFLFLHYGVFRECKRCLPVMLTEPRPPTY